ncbi:hypothetical protein ACFY93_12695 [Streptomyces sp. NPDC008313]|uniref:hypothetical protein n=1 Tax=Streptomyces sp. NPDC008313 TaxID=3364826 RepID=UPI0036EA66A6
MTDSKDGVQADEQSHDLAPWWADLGTWGAVVLIVLGGLAAAWVFFWPPGTSEETAQGYYQAAKPVAIGLVIAGSALLGNRRARAGTPERMNERERD